MSFSYPLTFPATKGPQSQTWQLRSAVGALESDFTLQQQVQEHDGERWEIAMQFPRMEPLDAGPYRAFFAMLRGKRGTFLIGDYTRRTALGAIAGLVGQNPLVKGGSQSGNSLTIDGVSNNITGLFVAGDWIQIGTGGASKLYMVVADCNSNGSGEATLSIVPELRESPADNAAIIYANCVGHFRLEKNDPTIFTSSGPNHSSFSFSAVEVL